MPVYALVELTVTDASWIEEYSKNVSPLLLSYGGKYLTSSDNIDMLEGEGKPQYAGVVEFPSRELAMQFYNSKEYKPYRDARLAGSKSRYLVIDVENGES
ncbi:DUF1330 domain-containing protein [Marinomonas mediterranea]|uniref:DUF1330 domain-containing protein n=1 Tax=Marinomonas mediterranea TaxID=119864 RepID=UPI0023498F67|nr:DUF1330 domain-containing protein [Marinomonas mediterranea]WCN13611.1 DUF1330 domain-containing protein [Marinomonas mediterranea]